MNAPTAGTQRALTETMFVTALQSIWNAGGSPKEVLANGTLKTKISSFVGGGTKQQNAKDKTVHQSVDLYVSDFGTVSITAHRNVTSSTVIAYDPELWAIATLRKYEKQALGKTGDSEKFLLVTETSLESKNEAGNAKIADLNG